MATSIPTLIFALDAQKKPFSMGRANDEEAVKEVMQDAKRKMYGSFVFLKGKAADKMMKKMQWPTSETTKEGE